MSFARIHWAEQKQPIRASLLFQASGFAGFFKEISALLAANAEGFITTGGHFNCVMNKKMDKHPLEQGPRFQKTKTLCNMIEELGLVDIWCHKHSRERERLYVLLKST